MASAESASLKKWVRTIPSSRMVFPRRNVDRAKYVFWRAYTPFHPYVRMTCNSLRITRHSGRQDFLFGTLKAEYSVQDLVAHLVAQGWGNHFIAWKDDGQVVSLRYVENFVYQYHLRVFEDGEVRGHYELTPESYPFLHLRAVGQEERREFFMDLLQDFLDKA